MKKYFIQFNNNAKHNYELVVVEGNKESIIALNKKTTDNYLHLPEECVKATNRRLISIKMIESANVDRYEVVEKEYKEPRKLGPRKSDIEYLSDEDKALYKALLERAQSARIEANKKPELTQREKLLRQIEKLTQKLNELGE